MISHGPSAVALVDGAGLYRVSVPWDLDEEGGVWLTLSTDGKYLLDDSAPAYARVAGSDVRLTKREAAGIRRMVAATMRSRTKPWRYFDSASPRRVRRPRRRADAAGAQNVSGASNGGNTRSPTGTTSPEASLNAP